MNPTTFKTAAAGAALMFSIGFSADAVAAFADCLKAGEGGYNISTRVNPSKGCTILMPLDANQNDSPTLINGERFFGFGDWVLDGKFDDIEKADQLDTSDLFNFLGDPVGGQFFYVGANPVAYSNIMLVFKDGADTNLVAYELDMDLMLSNAFLGSGSYLTPFLRTVFPLQGASNFHEVSHISVFYRSTTVAVPEPGSLALLGLALAGIGAMRRRA